MTTLELVARWGAVPKIKVISENIQLGDGYNLIAGIGTRPIEDSWEVQSPALPYHLALQTKQALETLAGSSPFQWAPGPGIPTREYRCEAWRIDRAGLGGYRISGTFTKVYA
jgi:phage-related protein